MTKKQFLLPFLLIFMTMHVVVLSQPASNALTGDIAFIGLDNNVYTINLADDSISQLTEDATRLRRYQWPTWSSDGQLAYFCCDTQFASSMGIEVYISPNATTTGTLEYQDDTEVLTYAYWSPTNCADNAECGGLAVLLSQLRSNAFVVKVFGRDRQMVDVGFGSPFYYSWSPDGTRLLTFRNNRIYEIFRVDDETTEALAQTPGIVQAPSWSPIDDRLLVGIAGVEPGTSDLAIIADDDVHILAEGIPGLVSFNWSPDGNQIAYRSVTNDGYGQLYVLDAVTGEQIAFSFGAEVIAFFWSPDSKRIAYATPATSSGVISARELTTLPPQAQQDIQLSWSTLTIQDGIVQRYTDFVPTSEMLYLLAFFDQFAQSHRIWSPDSSHLVFSEITREGKLLVSVLDVNRADAVPFFISDGRVGIWSYE